MFVIGLQEVVPLTAQQIVQTDVEKRFLFKCIYFHAGLTLLIKIGTCVREKY